jgi:hypothetical protein
VSLFSEIIGEEWDGDADGLDLVSHDLAHARSASEAKAGVVVGRLARFSTPIGILKSGELEAAHLCGQDVMRVAVAVLGKRALAWMLSFQDCHDCAAESDKYGGGVSFEPCLAHHTEYTAILIEAKRLEDQP